MLAIQVSWIRRYISLGNLGNRSGPWSHDTVQIRPKGATKSAPVNGGKLPLYNSNDNIFDSILNLN